MRGNGKDWKREGRRKGGGGALLLLEEPELSLEELEMPLAELEPAKERLAISLTMGDFLFKKKKM